MNAPIPLGRYNGKYVIQTPEGFIMVVKGVSQPAQFINLATLAYWKSRFPSPRGSVDWLSATDWLLAECRAKGEWIPPRSWHEIPESKWRMIKTGQWFRVTTKQALDDFKFYLEEGTTANGARSIKGLDYATFAYTWHGTHGEVERLT